MKLSGMRGKGLGPSPNFFVMVGSLLCLSELLMHAQNFCLVTFCLLELLPSGGSISLAPWVKRWWGSGLKNDGKCKGKKQIMQA